MYVAQIRRGSSQSTAELDSVSSVLAQLLLQGISVDYACKRGECGQCRVELLAGAVKPLEAAWPYRSGSSSVLLCNVIAQSDLKIDVPHLQELAGIQQLKVPAKIHQLVHLSEDVLEVYLRLPPSTQFRFLAGQFIRVTNGEKVTRSYSLAAPVAEDKLLRVQVRRVGGGAFSDWLFGRAKLGELLYVEGPCGKFFFRDAGEFKKSIFLATGTGVAPIYAILAALTPDQVRRAGSIHVYWGNRSRNDAYFIGELTKLLDRLGAGLTLVFSSEATNQGRRYVQDYLLDEHPDLSSAQVFAAGSSLMTAAAAEVCSRLGLPEDCYHSDPFTVS
ncbi:MAG: FAD-binding oxidoreductase [Stagnimonas sp.]|nr:FAD-binding oxidoreductase [Stagnimonas sp.]